MSDFMSERTELFPFTHHVSIGPLIIDNSKKPTLLPPMEIQNEVSTLRAQVQQLTEGRDNERKIKEAEKLILLQEVAKNKQLTEENDRLKGACNKEFESVQTLNNECQKLRACLKCVEEYLADFAYRAERILSEPPTQWHDRKEAVEEAQQALAVLDSSPKPDAAHPE